MRWGFVLAPQSDPHIRAFSERAPEFHRLSTAVHPRLAPPRFPDGCLPQPRPAGPKGSGGPTTLRSCGYHAGQGRRRALTFGQVVTSPSTIALTEADGSCGQQLDRGGRTRTSSIEHPRARRLRLARRLDADQRGRFQRPRRCLVPQHLAMRRCGRSGLPRHDHNGCSHLCPVFTADTPSATATTGMAYGPYTYTFMATGNPAPTFSVKGELPRVQPPSKREQGGHVPGASGARNEDPHRHSFRRNGQQPAEFHSIAPAPCPCPTSQQALS